MAITYVGGTTANGGNSAWNMSLTSLTGGLASAPVQNDIVVINITMFGTDSTTRLNSSGWTIIADQFSNDTGPVNNWSYYKIMGSTPDTTIAFLASGSSSRTTSVTAQTWRGIDLTTPLDVATTVATGGNTSTVTNPAITPVTSGSVIIIGGGSTGNTGAVNTLSSSPSGYGNILFKSSISSSYASNSVLGSKSWVSGIETPGSWVLDTTSTNNAWCAWSLVLRPAVTVTNFQINIADTWKTVESIQININDEWKTVTEAQINIGDSWKSIY